MEPRTPALREKTGGGGAEGENKTENNIENKIKNSTKKQKPRTKTKK